MITNKLKTVIPFRYIFNYNWVKIEQIIAILGSPGYI